jgi:hypothetical protein
VAKHHHNKDINKAIEYAISKGWRYESAKSRGHIDGTLYCPAGTREGHRLGVACTPRVPEDWANRIRKEVDDCQHSVE